MTKKQLPLEHMGDNIEPDPVTGTMVRRTVWRRGLLKREEWQYQDIHASFSALADQDVRGAYEDLLDRARDVLRSSGLPTDEDKDKLQLPDGRTFPLGWSKIVKERTEPLSRERLAMELIWSIKEILQGEHDDSTLWRIWRFMNNSHNFILAAVKINEAVVSAYKAEKGRRKGPEVKAAAASRKKEIIRELSSAYWKRTPVNRGNVSATAEAIKEDLNNRFHAEGLKPIGSRSIIRHLAEQLVQTSHSL